MTIATAKSKFSVGQLIHHRLFGYRGVIADIHPVFQGTEEWYEQVAQSRPPIDEPWYRILPHRAVHETYVAERNLEADTKGSPILHPLVEVLFEDFRDGVYVHLVH
jgi:heat shock protein HspQ